MKRLICILVLALAVGTSCASTGPDHRSHELQDAAILERSAIPPYTGFIRTWIQFRVKADGAERLLLLPHFEGGRRIPEVGESCQIQYHAEAIEGLVGDRSVRAETASVVDRMECERG